MIRGKHKIRHKGKWRLFCSNSQKQKHCTSGSKPISPTLVHLQLFILHLLLEGFCLLIRLMRQTLRNQSCLSYTSIEVYGTFIANLTPGMYWGMNPPKTTSPNVLSVKQMNLSLERCIYSWQNIRCIYLLFIQRSFTEHTRSSPGMPWFKLIYLPKLILKPTKCLFTLVFLSPGFACSDCVCVVLNCP